ncbi:hypothetical protein E2C01_031868 [Portunus trituberculatus]|uniref:Uncharacterized protein n=1 Tax=Portunus trituberculatus TaxID=210409 RepID=A0A5B7EVW7_PORTR|nr:hypothetical protein [Portunus trituberculatus]
MQSTHSPHTEPNFHTWPSQHDKTRLTYKLGQRDSGPAPLVLTIIRIAFIITYFPSRAKHMTLNNNMANRGPERQTINHQEPYLAQPFDAVL